MSASSAPLSASDLSRSRSHYSASDSAASVPQPALSWVAVPLCFRVSLSAAIAVANAAYEQMACPTHGISEEVAHILSGEFSQRCIFIGCTLSEALQDGSGGTSIAQPIHLDSTSGTDSVADAARTFAVQSDSGSCILLARAIVSAASAGLIDASTVFADLAREVSSWEKFAQSVSGDVYPTSRACGSNRTINHHIHFMTNGAVQVSQSVFNVTRPAALAMIIHCMTQLLPGILKSTLACFKTLRYVLPLLDLSKIIIAPLGNPASPICYEGMHSIFIELLLHCCSAQPTSILLLHALASPLQQSPLRLLRCAGDIHRLLQLHSLAGQLIRVGRDSLLDRASRIANARETIKRSHSEAFSSAEQDTQESRCEPATLGMKQLLRRIIWDASVESGCTSKRIKDPTYPSESSSLDLLLIGSNMRFNPSNTSHLLTPELWSHISDTCVLSCTELAGRCDELRPSHSLQLPVDFCQFASALIKGLRSGWSFEYIMLGARPDICNKNFGSRKWLGVRNFFVQQLRSAEPIENFVKHICTLFALQSSVMPLTPPVFASFLIILDAGLSDACSREMLEKHLCSGVLPPFPCPSIAAHAAQLGPQSKQAQAKLWAAFGQSASDGDVLARALEAACYRFNCTGLGTCLKEFNHDAVGLVSLGVIRASIAIFRRSSKYDRTFVSYDPESSRSRWTSVLVALHSAGVISIDRLVQYLPGIYRYPVDENFLWCRSLSQCINPTHVDARDDTTKSLLRTIPSQPQSDASVSFSDLEVPTYALKSPMFTKSSPNSSLLSVKHDLKDYISWRVQLALLPPSCATLRQVLGDLTSKLHEVSLPMTQGDAPCSRLESAVAAMLCLRNYCISTSNQYLAKAEREWQVMAASSLDMQTLHESHETSSSSPFSSSSHLMFQEGSAFYRNGSIWLGAIMNLMPMLTVCERRHIFKYSLYLADNLTRREWFSADKMQWLDNKLPILLMWEWACDSIGTLLVASASDVLAVSVLTQLLDLITSRDADASNIRFECFVDLLRKLSAFKLTWQSGGGYCLLAKLLMLASATSEPLRVIEVHFSIACVYSMTPGCRLCETKGMRNRCEPSLKRSCCDAATADICARLCSSNSSSLMASLSHIRSSVYSIYHVVCLRAAVIIPSLLRGHDLLFLASTDFDYDTLRAKIRDIFLNSKFPEAVLKLRQFIEGLKPKWNASVQQCCNDQQVPSSSSALQSTEFRTPARNAPATVGEQAALFACNGDVDGMAFNSFLMMLIVFEGSNYFGIASVSLQSDDGDAEKGNNCKTSDASNFSTFSLLPSFVHTCHASSVIAAVLRSFRFRGGIDKRSCSLTADLIPRAVFLWLSEIPCISLSFVGTSYDPARCAAALICCVSKGLISFGSFNLWLLYPALQHVSKYDRTKECHRLLALASNMKQKYSHLDVESSQSMRLAIDNAANNEASVQFWLELIRIVSDSKVGGSHSGIVPDWDARAVRDMLNDVAPSEGDMSDFSVESIAAPGPSILITTSCHKHIVANQIARIMIDVSLHGSNKCVSDAKNCSNNFMGHLSLLFYSHVLACTTCDPFDDDKDNASCSSVSTASTTDAFLSIKLQEFRSSVSSCALSDALIFAQNRDHDDFSNNGSKIASTGPSLQTLMAMNYTSAQFISRVSKFFIAAVEIGLVLIGSGTVPAFAAATALRNLCPTLTSRYFNHMLLLVTPADTTNYSCQHSSPCHNHNPQSSLFAPLDHALPLLHHCACSQHFYSWANVSASHAASALRERSTEFSSINSDHDASGVFDANNDAIGGIAHHCSSMMVSTLLRKLHLELGLDATIQSENVGEHVYIQEHDLVSLVHEWICESAVSSGADKSIYNGSRSSVSVWRCEAFRDLNCSFMELACSPSLMLTSLGVVASRLSACDVIFQHISSVTWQQATLHLSPSSASKVMNDENAHLERPKHDHLHLKLDRSMRQRVFEYEDVSLTDDEHDDANHEEIPDSCNNHDLQFINLQQHVGAPLHEGPTSMFPDFSNEVCRRKLHDAIMLLPTAVGEAMHIVRMLACLVRSLDAGPLKDDSVPTMTNIGGTISVLCSCVTAVCVLYARVCTMSIAAEMISQHSPLQQSLLRLLARVRDTLCEAAKLTCFSVALACGGGTLYRNIVASTHHALQLARLPAHLFETVAAVASSPL